MSEEVGYDSSLTEEQNYVRFVKHVKSLISTHPAPDKLALAVGHVEALIDRLESIRDTSLVLIAARSFVAEQRAAIKAAD